MDCYVEFETPNDAKAAVDRVNKIQETGRPPRLGNRHVDVEVSSQDALLKDLFPRAKCIKWQDGMPILLENHDPYSSGFSGFLTSEEIVGCLRHAELPHRVRIHTDSIWLHIYMTANDRLVSFLSEMSSAHLRVYYQHSWQGKFVPSLG